MAATDQDERRLAVDVDPSSPAAARGFVRAVLRGWGRPDLEDVVLLLVSELVTNLVLHARTPGELVVRHRPPSVRVEVHDGDPRLPEQRPHDIDASTGRGMVLLAGLAAAWGAEPEADGKVVWFEVVTPPVRPARSGGARH